MRIVDLAWQNDPRLRWVSLKAPAKSPVKADSAPAAAPEAPLPGSVAQQLAEKLAEEEKRKQDWERLSDWADAELSKTMDFDLAKSKSYVEFVSGELLRSRRIHITYIYG